MSFSTHRKVFKKDLSEKSGNIISLYTVSITVSLPALITYCEKKIW